MTDTTSTAQQHPSTPETRESQKPAEASRLTYSPHVDICDAGDALTVFADLPGAKPEEIDVQYEDGVLSLHACVQPRPLPGRMLKQEFGIGDYRRSFRLGDGFDASQITAESRHGVLTIRVPRMAAVRPRKIAVSPR
jgi:HSP20 family protein